MTRATNLPLPPADFVGLTKYAIFPREKRAFHTVLDAHKILAGSTNPVSEVRYAREGEDIVVGLDHPIADGRLREEMRLVRSRDGEGLMMKAMTRQVFDAA
jgi:hypothetical protein